MIHQLQEHGLLSTEPTDRFNNLRLVSWDKPMDNSPWGYHASYKIGAEWIDDVEALVVTTKRGMENIDFLGMFMTCFSSGLAIERFSTIYQINSNQPTIEAPALTNIVSPLIVFHFIGVVSRIKALKKGYVHHEENLLKVKGRVKLLNNERKNISTKRYERVYCNYTDYSVDIPENRLIKKALLFSQAFLSHCASHHQSLGNIKTMLVSSLRLFENVSGDVDMRDVRQVKSHKLFKEYAEAVRLAKMVLKHFDYSISKVSQNDGNVTPFVLDMSLLYEHYVYGLLNQAYHEKIIFQYQGKTGYPDFLYCSEEFKAILDTKYIPKYQDNSLDTYVVRQLSGYGRDLAILRKLGFDNLCEESETPPVPCVVIYPEEGIADGNPFDKQKLSDLCVKVPGLSQFYTMAILLPSIRG